MRCSSALAALVAVAAAVTNQWNWSPLPLIRAGAALPRGHAARLPAARINGDALELARESFKRRNWQEVVDVLQDLLKRSIGDVEVHELLGQALLNLGRADEAAHHFEQAISHAEGGRSRKAEKLLRQADKLAARRGDFFKKVAGDLFEVGKKLYARGDSERALKTLAPLLPIAEGNRGVEILALIEEIRAASQAVDLDGAGSQEAATVERELVEIESEHYVVRANLERDLAQLVADTMDDIFGSYVQIYSDGKVTGAMRRKATIRIHPNKQAMLAGWTGGSQPEGWWSPGEWTVTCYDTRSASGNLDFMLLTLFHEASHQFMSILDKGGGAPSWLNEGTASFFEGATAMADGRVLWPDAAAGRLQSLNYMLDSKAGPTVEQVIGYSEPSSYPGEYYPFGWGLVYFMQQYEDPETLEYVFRPVYAAYRDRILKRGGNSRQLFDQVFLAEDAPGNFASFEDFAQRWQDWIQKQVHALHFGPQRRELREALIDKYVAAADSAAGDRKAPVGEQELLLRALGHLEHVRAKIDAKAKVPDARLLLLQADVLERLGRGSAAAPLLETYLGLVDSGQIELDEPRAAELEQRLAKLDSKNSALRAARARAQGLRRDARALLEAYESSAAPMLLRGYTFAQLAGAALGDDDVLLPAAARLRGAAREAGLLLGSIVPFSARPGDWKTIFTGDDGTFDADGGAIGIEGVRPVARIDTSSPVNGEYELRFTLGRIDPVRRASFHGVVVAGRLDTDWAVVGLDGRGRLWSRRMRLGEESGFVVDSVLDKVTLDPPVAKSEHPELVIHVFPTGKVTVQVGKRKPVELDFGTQFPPNSFCGIYAKDGRTELLDGVIEIYP
jgi:tetratricopeptide (TPR) repeat protein